MTDGMDQRAAFDMHMMAIALRMARRGLGTTAFNPSVGAVIADHATGEVIARGWTQPGGRPHGEQDALRQAGERARGKTMYVTLEPCAHTGRTPTCADAILTAGLKRVVCAQADPNPIIAGRGFDQLRAAGIAVDVGLLEDQARALTLGHILHVTKERPFVQAKLAVSADDRIAAGNGAPVWVTGPEARAAGHRLRAGADLVISGIGTVLADDPALTCRLPGLAHRSPHRLIVDSRLRTPATARVLAAGADPTHKIWIATSYEAVAPPPLADLNARRDDITILRVGIDRPDLGGIMSHLDREPIRRVLLEAGPRLTRAFLDADLIDELVLFRGTGRLGSAGLAPLAGLACPATFDDTVRWQCVDRRAIGADAMITYRKT